MTKLLIKLTNLINVILTNDLNWSDHYKFMSATLSNTFKEVSINFLEMG